VRKEGFITTEEEVGDEVTFVPLLGQFGWREDTA
jgi:hypothetical protein